MARISEMHYSNAYANQSGVQEFLEVSLATTEDPADFSVSFYQDDGSLYLTVPLDDPGVIVTYDPDSNENVYVIDGDVFNVRLTDPDGSGANNTEAYALTNDDTGEVVDFYDLGGGTTEITATEGPALGATSRNIPLPTVPDLSTYSVQFNQPNPDQVELAALSRSSSGMVCFGAGTRVATPGGWRRVEDLAPGDLVETLDAGARPLAWVARRTVRAYGPLAPVIISEGALGNVRPLVVSPQHRMLVKGWRAEMLFGEHEVLVAAQHLIDGRDVVRREGGRVTYVHLLFDRHQLVFAEGSAAESFHPGDHTLNHMPDAARAELFAVFPGLAQGAHVYGRIARRSLSAPEAAILRGPPDGTSDQADPAAGLAL
ncbi:MAG: Hint domain-containing protein [Pseudomonadota bacterium]